MIRALLLAATIQTCCLAQSNSIMVAPTDSSCPVEIAKVNPSHESLLDNMRTLRTYGNTTVSAHNKFLEVKVKNNTDKTIRGITFVTAYYDATEDLHTIPVAWGLHREVKPEK